MTLVLLIILACLITFAYASLSAAPWVPTRGSDITRFMRIARIQPDERVYDLGCGDGRIVRASAQVKARAVGYEISFIPFLLARISAALLPRHAHARVQYKNFWHADLRDADVVYFFLMPKIYQRLKEKLERELKPGARVIAYVWPIPGWTPITVDKEKEALPLYLYIVGPPPNAVLTAM